MKYLGIFLSTFIISFSLLQFGLRENSKVLITNDLGSPIRWKKFPIKFYFQKDFPLSKRLIIFQEILVLNSLVQKNVIEISFEDMPKDKSVEELNIIYMGSEDKDFFKECEQAKTQTHWAGSEFIKADVVFNPEYMNADYDFPSLVRHEFSHALGIRHIGEGNNGLMSPKLMMNQVKDWEPGIIAMWKEDMKMDKSSSFSPMASTQEKIR